MRTIYSQRTIKSATTRHVQALNKTKSIENKQGEEICSTHNALKVENERLRVRVYLTLRDLGPLDLWGLVQKM
jgi:hypothetical protein